MKRKTLFVAALAAGVVFLSGCSQPSQQTIESNPAALQAAVEQCPVAFAPASKDCSHMQEAELKVIRQYAAGRLAEDAVASAVFDLYGRTQRLPVSNEQAGAPSSVPPTVADLVRSVTVGPTPGVFTVTWSHTAIPLLADKSLVLIPVQSRRSPYLCWKIDPSSTVPPAVIQLPASTVLHECEQYG